MPSKLLTVAPGPMRLIICTILIFHTAVLVSIFTVTYVLQLAQIPIVQIISNLEHATCPNNDHLMQYLGHRVSSRYVIN